MKDGREAGQRAERVAARFLARRGLRILARNVRCRGGELDLVGQDGPVLVFVEVRSRSASLSQTPVAHALASIGAAKRRRLVRAARWYLATRPELAGRPARFDVVAVTLDGAGRPVAIRHVVGAFAADGH